MHILFDVLASLSNQRNNKLSMRSIYTLLHACTRSNLTGSALSEFPLSLAISSAFTTAIPHYLHD